MKISLHRLLHFDGIAALSVGLFLLLLREFLSALLGLPVWLVTTQACINLAYSAYSLPLALRNERPEWMIRLLAVANMVYGFLVVPVLLWRFFASCTVLGVLHFLLEVVVIGGLGVLEWRALKQKG